MKILLVGSDKVFAIENFFARHLRSLGVDVYHFAAQSTFFDYYQKNILNKIVYRSGFSDLYRRINNEFRRIIETYKPDVIWVFKGMEIYPESLILAKSKGIFLTNYNPDNPFIFSGRGSGNYNITNSIKLYDLHLTYHSGVQKKIIEEYHIPAQILPFGFEVDEKLYLEISQQEKTLRTCFLGNPDADRISFIKQLADEGVMIDVHGNKWSSFVKHKNIQSFDPVYARGYWQQLNKYRVQLNLMRLHNPDTHNMRTFEIPGIGGIQLAPKTQDHCTYFTPGKEIFIYNSLEECVQQISAIQAMTEAECSYFRNQARIRSVSSGYSYKDRAKEALEYIKPLVNVD